MPLHDSDAETVVAPNAVAAATVAAPGPPIAATDALQPVPFEERYLKPRVIGRGGMGEVRVYFDSVTGREIAMKVPIAGRKRFVREARVQAQLEHPGVVPVYDLGLLPGGAPFFSMKRIRGLTLDVKERELPRRRLLAHFATVCLTVEYAHARGVIHRDLKPANIMLGDFGEVYVLDWGVAALTEPDPKDRMTAPGAVIGTPAYMAPEQARGFPATKLTDVFALGAILFELLTGNLLLNQDPNEDAVTTAQRRVEARPSVRYPEAEIPPELEEICVKATAFSPTDRYASARALHDAVAKYLDGERDLDLRHTVAERRSVEAASMLRAATSDARRTKAVRELCRALALDPAHDRAMRSLLAVLSRPELLPPSLRREVLAGRAGFFARNASWLQGALGLMAMVPLLGWVRLRDWVGAPNTLALCLVGIATLSLLFIGARRAARRANDIAAVQRWQLMQKDFPAKESPADGIRPPAPLVLHRRVAR